MNLDRVSVVCFLASYAVGLLLELTQFVHRSRGVRWLALGFMGAGLIAHTIYLIVRSRQQDLPPLLRSPHDWLLVSAWLIVVLYWGIQIWNLDLALGVFCDPIVLLLVGASRFVNTAPIPQAVDRSQYWWKMLHASFLSIGLLGVALSLVVSLMYLVQHNRLKHKRAEVPALHLFSLERLGQINWWLVILSVPMLTLGMLTGLLLIFLSQGGAHPVNVLSFALSANGAVWAAMAVLFGWLLTSKHPTGRLVAWRTALTCGFLLVTMLVLILMQGDGIHGGPA